MNGSGRSEKTRTQGSLTTRLRRVLRRIYVSTKVRAGLTQMERFELALSMKHSPLATLKYVRAFKNKTDDAAANNELPRNY